MKNILYLSLAAVTLALGSCSNEDDFGGQSAIQGNDVISAVTPSKDTRTSMNGTSVLWDAGDAIGVISTKVGETDNNTQYTLSQGAGTGSGEFSGMSESGYTKVAAYYPYNASVKFANSELSLILPESYTYDANHPESNNKAPMACLIEQGAQSDISFKHAGALMHIELKNIPQNCTAIKLTSANADCKLTGAAKITFASGTPTLAIASEGTQATAETEGDTPAEGHTITIHFTNTAAGSTKSFYFPIPVYNYTALTLSVEGTGDFKPQTIKSKPLNAERGTRYNSTLTFDEMSGVLPTEVESVEKVTEVLANTNAVLVADVADNQGSSGTTTAPQIALPKVAEGAPAAESVSIAFDKISTENTITIKEDDNSGSTGGGDNVAVAKAVTIAIPPAATSTETGGSKAPKVDIQLENSTVTLAANGETATFAEVTAATADNTLVVENGVTITKLTIKKGNIRLKGNAAITELAKDKSLSGTTVQIIVEGEEYTLPSGGVPTGFELVDGVAADLNKVATEGGEYILPANVTGDFVVSATKPVIIELNGHKITNKSGDTFTVNFGSTLTINGNGTVDNVTHGKACIYNNGEVVLEGGEYTRSKEAGTFTPTNSANGNSYYNILNHGIMTINPGVNVHANGSHSSLIASGYYSYKAKPEQQASARSNYVSGTNYEYPSLTIKGGTFEGGLNTVKNDDGATLTIENGTFTNTAQAPVQNNHIAVIKDGTFTPQGIATHVVESRYSDATYDLGQTTISGGTFNGVLYLDGDSPSLTISGGIFNGTFDLEKASSPSLTISGGTFSDPHALDYLTAGAKVNVNLLADTKLEKSVVMTKGTATFDLQKHTLTAGADAKVQGTYKDGNVAIAVKDGAKLTVQNGSIGNSSNGLLYGVFAFGTGDVTLNNILFSEKVTYAFNGVGKLAATGCTFKGWLSGWHHGGTFTDCTFTIGKNWYPATICYGNTTFSTCKFFNNDTDADVYDDKNSADPDGYYRCNYVVAGCNPTTTIDFSSCKFMNEQGTVTDNVTASNHPYHACSWGDGKVANANVKVGGTVVTTKCSDASK